VQSLHGDPVPVLIHVHVDLRLFIEVRDHRAAVLCVAGCWDCPRTRCVVASVAEGLGGRLAQRSWSILHRSQLIQDFFGLWCVGAVRVSINAFLERFCSAFSKNISYNVALPLCLNFGQEGFS
jgi:hypothetical protein